MASNARPGDIRPEEMRAREWYAPESPELSASTRDVLQNYSKVKPEDINDHISTIRDKAWAIHHYPCIGQWRFLELFIGNHSLYPEVLERMRSGNEIFLDLGCAFAQDVRRLVADGVDSSKCYGADLRLDFIGLGYELFRDKDTLKTKFIEADIFDEQSDLSELDGRVDIIGASSFFHLFDYDQQVQVGKRVARLFRQRNGSLLVGRQVGNENAQHVGRSSSSSGRFRHNEESWKKMWDEIGEEVGMKFEVISKLRERPASITDVDPGTMIQEFSVRVL